MPPLFIIFVNQKIAQRMKKTILFIFSFISFSTNFYAQDTIKKDSLLIEAKKLQTDANSQNESVTNTDAQQKAHILSPEEIKQRAEFVKMLQFKAPDIYVGPPTQNKDWGEKLPHTNDYTYGDYEDLGNNVYLGMGSAQRSYISIGAMRMANANLNYQPSEWIGFSVGMYGAKYNAYGFHYNDFGVDAAIRVKLHDRIYLRGHGRYSVNMHEQRFIGPANMNMFPQTYYGGGVEFKINDNFGIEGGMMREFNPMKRKWENRPYLMPIFYRSGRR